MRGEIGQISLVLDAGGGNSSTRLAGGRVLGQSVWESPSPLFSLDQLAVATRRACGCLCPRFRGCPCPPALWRARALGAPWSSHVVLDTPDVRTLVVDPPGKRPGVGAIGFPLRGGQAKRGCARIQAASQSSGGTGGGMSATGLVVCVSLNLV